MTNKTPVKNYDDEELGGWARIARQAVANIHDRLVYGTKKRKEAIEEAADEEPDAEAKRAGFKKSVK